MKLGRLGLVLGVSLTAIFLQGAVPPKEVKADRYVSMARAEVFMREGPSFEHKVLWVYRRQNLPLKVIAEYDIWRRVRDYEGTTGWIQGSMLSSARSIIVTAAKPVPLRDNRQPDARITTYVAPGVVAKVQRCMPKFCEIVATGAIGWIKKDAVWGVELDEEF